MQTVKKYNQKTPTITVRSSFSLRRQTADDEGQKKIVQKKRERERECVCVEGPPGETTYFALLLLLSLSLSPPPALNLPQ